MWVSQRSHKTVTRQLLLKCYIYFSETYTLKKADTENWRCDYIRIPEQNMAPMKLL